ncbi:unnamed protein product [Diamesa tonsa]
MSTEPVKILSASVQEVLKLIEIKAKQQSNNIDCFSVLENEFVQLSFLIGEVVERALNIIDTKTITLYRSASKGNREIIEITGTNIMEPENLPEIRNCVVENINFAATIKSSYIKLFMNVIKALNFVDNTEIQLSAEGLKYVVEESKSFQTTAYVKKDFFSRFIYRAPDDVELLSFGVKMTTFTEFLNAFLDNDLSSMKMIYYGEGNPLAFIFTQVDSLTNDEEETVDEDDEEEEAAGEITTEYILRTKQSLDLVDFNVSNPLLGSSLIVLGPDLFAVLNYFDRSVDELEISITNKELQFKSIGILQYETDVKIDRHSDSFVTYNFQENTKFCYKYTFFKVMLKSFVLASKIALETHLDGMLKIQLMVKSGEEEVPIFVEYFLVPTLDQEED